MKQYLAFGVLFELYKNKDPLSARDLAEKFEISTRSVYRYLNELESAGIPTYTKQGKNGGIGIYKNFSMEGLVLNDDEKTCLKHAINTLPSDMKNHLINKLML